MGRYLYTGVTVQYNGAKKIFLTPHSQAICNTWTVPDGVTCLTFEIWGGGGAGSPTCCCTCYGGLAGDGGAYSIKTLAVTPGTVYTYNVGKGGCGNACYFNDNACGCGGGTTYITGTGLTNFCASGGAGGQWCNANPCNCAKHQVGAVSYGGDLNLQGFPARRISCCFSGACWGDLTGSSPFGGGFHFRTPPGSCTSPTICSPVGVYPGGGGAARAHFTDGWCDCCRGCNGAGSDGLIIITV